MTETILPRRTPAAAGIPASALAALADRLQDEGLDPHALTVVSEGAVVFETAWAPYRLERAVLVYSASKTYTSLAIGFLADEGRLSLDDSAGDLLGEPNPHGLTVRHLLTMNTGHSAAQIDAVGDDPRGLLRTAPAREPGTRFAYNSPATHALSAIVTAVTGEPLTTYLRPRLLDPLGIGERWMSTYGGIEHGASGFHVTVDDLARTGVALAAGGTYAGHQVVPARYVDEMSRPWSQTADFDGPPSLPGETNDWALGYGYQVWRSRHGFRLDGAAGQFSLVLPEHDLVIAYQGATLETQAVLRAFWSFVEAVAISRAAGLDGAETGPAAAGVAPGGADGTDSGATSPEAALAVPRDTWDARDRLEIMTEAPFDNDGLTLDDRPDGWALVLPGVGEVPVGPQWRTIACESQAESTAEGENDPESTDSACNRHAEPTTLALATRGETLSDGGVRVHVVDTTSPHRVIVHRDADGAVRAGWHIPPLGGGWEALRVPASVPRVTVPAAALLLDMDGTLVDSHAVVERVWTQWSLDHGIDPAHTLSIIHGRQGQDSMALLLPDRPHEVNLEENAELLAAETAQTDGVVAIAGAAQLLEQLRDVPHALVTSATVPLARVRMEAAGLRMPAVAITAEDVARSKPDPEGFLAAAAALGVEPADCIVVEDSANGIAAGLAAGMRVIGIGPAAAAASPTWTVADAAGIRVASTPTGAVVTIGD